VDLIDLAAPQPIVVDQGWEALAAGAAGAMTLHAIGLEGRAAAGYGEIEQFGILADLLERGGPDAVDEGRAGLGLGVKLARKFRAAGIAEEARRMAVDPWPRRVEHAIDGREHDCCPEGIEPP